MIFYSIFCCFCFSSAMSWRRHEEPSGADDKDDREQRRPAGKSYKDERRARDE